ncbi:uncharacterized protein LACBIDRAFT_301407 [Laccaria bicolor S238N-H82]|uniref:Predicted protein n=1 Tax=Laccaria bicolor (strain S238N-H82 / ATCC MYA-4686) TaxID=486041 RepID=B0CNG9_LACBS|nr:uncharacterized protein LACBIDRAFT_301407 [Laccaria bicolor S238N-H82]EDR15925.1 predicted protein [Laccaria bicolor S238N-H82]|eukprot:XP_001874133.1 predicted protein [Laccaria bicolor S238N-H82]
MCEVQTIPSFYFNFKSSLFGKLQPSLSSGSRIVPHKYFLATKLLPCSKADGSIKKFTRNDEIGNAMDDLTKAIHAFAHFLLIYSHSHLLFCDLRGAYDFNGKMCLFNPQAHTFVLYRNILHHTPAYESTTETHQIKRIVPLIGMVAPPKKIETSMLKIATKTGFVDVFLSTMFMS